MSARGGETPEASTDAAGVRKAGVIGAGTMGSGIAQLFLQNGFTAVLHDSQPGALSAARARIAEGLARAGRPEALDRLQDAPGLEALASCDFAVEAVAEDLEVKRGIFRRLGELLPAPRVLATNTSSLPVASIARAAAAPERVVGMHFFNPAPRMRLVEVVAPRGASERAVRLAEALAGLLGKTAVRCKDAPGFIANRVTRPFYLEGMRLLEEGAGGPAEIDRALRELGGFRMGPLELVDFIGLDVNLAISRVVYEALRRPERLRPREVQDRLVARGALGRKNGRGFYVYGEDGRNAAPNPLLRELVRAPAAGALPARDMLRAVLSPVIREAGLVAAEGVASEDDIDTAMRLGMNWPRGPIAWGRALAAAGALALALFTAAPARALSPRRLLPEASFPSAKDYFEPLLADPTELGYGGRYLWRVGGARYGEVTIGDYVGLLRWKLGPSAGLQWNLGGGVNARFNMSTARNNLEVADFTAAMPFDLYLLGGHAVRFGFWHTSSHLGDDFIRRTSPVFDKRSVDLLRAIYSWSPEERVRFYGGTYFAMNKVNLDGRTGLQCGAEFLSRRFWSNGAQVFAAQDLQAHARAAWNPSYTLRGGLRLSDSKRVAAARAFLEYFTGRMYYLQFQELHETRWGLGLSFEIGNPTRP